MVTKKGPFVLFDKQKRVGGRKTDWWIVFPTVGIAGRIGIVAWFTPWRKYCYFPEGGTVLDATCMVEISEFIVKQTELHREGQ